MHQAKSILSQVLTTMQSNQLANGSNTSQNLETSLNQSFPSTTVGGGLRHTDFLPQTLRTSHDALVRNSSSSKWPTQQYQ